VKEFDAGCNACGPRVHLGWIERAVNAIVFAAVLATIWVANFVVLRGRGPSLAACWPLLLVFVGLNFALPLDPVLALDGPVRVAVASLMIGLPVFFAAICFSRLFAREAFTGYALGINLVGAMGGGLIEYVSMVIGMRSIRLLVLVVYLTAWLATRLTRTTAEGDKLHARDPSLVALEGDAAGAIAH
jgi:hypothetical protein